MKKTLLLAIVAFLAFSTADAQSVCRIDTVYRFRYVDGSTTKTPLGRTIYAPSPGNPATTFRSNIVQEFKNGAYVNKSKSDLAFNSSCTNNATEEIYSDWDSASTSWIVNYKANATLNADCNFTEYISQIPNGSGVLVNNEKYEYSYNSKGKQTLQLTSKWANGAWRNFEKYTFTFQNDTLRTNALQEKWDTTSSAWVNVRKIEAQYDANGRKLNEEIYQWDAASSAWKGVQKEVSVYGANGLTSFERLQWDPSTSSFINDQKFLYTRNSSGLTLTEDYQVWNTISNQFDFNHFRAYTYNNNNFTLTSKFSQRNATTGVVTSSNLATYTLNSANKPLVILQEDSSNARGGVWRPLRKTTNTYDANGNKINEIFEQRLLNADTFLTNDLKKEFEYNSNNRIIRETAQKWVASAWGPFAEVLREYDANDCLLWTEDKSSWNNSNSYFNTHNRFEYRVTSVTVGIEDVLENPISVYPNPVAVGSLLNVNLPQASNYLMTDYAGRVVKAGMFNEGINSINTNELSKGFYLLKLNNSTHKIILQ
jgi:hypothetical protein